MDRDGIPTLMPADEGRDLMIGNFELQTVLGRGGMGEVWKAWDQEGDRPVVIKLVPPELQRADEEMARVRDTFRRVQGVAESVNRALLIGLGKRRQERFASCLEFIQTIEGAQASQPVRKPTPEKPVAAAAKPFRVAAPQATSAAVPAKPHWAEPQIQAVTGPLNEITNSIGMKMLLILAGELLMGAAKSEADAYDDEKPQPRVRIAQPFYLGVYPVTQAEYQRVMGKNSSKFQGEDRRPVEMVSWKGIRTATACSKSARPEASRNLEVPMVA